MLSIPFRTTRWGGSSRLDLDGLAVISPQGELERILVPRSSGIWGGLDVLS